MIEAIEVQVTKGYGRLNYYSQTHHFRQHACTSVSRVRRLVLAKWCRSSVDSSRGGTETMIKQVCISSVRKHCIVILRRREEREIRVDSNVLPFCYVGEVLEARRRPEQSGLARVAT